MPECVIFCAGEFDNLAQPLKAGALIIAADGGYAHTQKLGLKPDVVLGDFDSLGYVPQDAQIYPVEKDDTDCMLAVRASLEKGCDSIVIYGALDGPRMDHTVANLQTLLYLARRGASGTLVGKHNIVTAVRNGTVRFDAMARGTVSVFCIGEQARGVTIRGLKYELQNGTLTPDYPLGVSNAFLGKEASVTVEDGTLILIYEASSGWRHYEERS